MDFEIPSDVKTYLDVLDNFIRDEIRPLEQKDDNIRFFDHRREYARTDFENGGLPRKDWEDLMRQARRVADKAGSNLASLTILKPAHAQSENLFTKMQKRNLIA